MDEIWRSAPLPALRVWQAGPLPRWEANPPALDWGRLEHLAPEDWQALASALLQQGDAEVMVPLRHGATRVACRVVALPDGALAWLVPSAVSLAMPDAALSRRDRETSEFLGRALVLADVEVWRIDLASRRVHYNLRGYQRLGIEPRLDGLDVEEVRASIHPDDRDAVLRAGEEALESDRVVDVIARYRNPDGSWRTLLTRRVAYRDETGRAVALAGVSMDLSDLVAEREHVVHLRERMELLANAVGLGLWTREVGTGIAEWNEQMYRIHRRSPSEGPPSLVEWLSRHVHPLDAQRMGREQHEADAAWAPTYHTEFRIPGDNGEVRWIYSWSRREVRHGKRLAFGVHIDITERRLAQQAVQRERDRAQFAIDAAGMGTWERSLDGEPLYWSERMYTLRGLDPKDPRPLAELAVLALGEQDHTSLTERMLRQLRNGQPYEREMQVRWPDGSVHWLMARGQLVCDDAGRPARFTGVNWDITERKRAEAAVLEAQRAEQANRAKSEFMARMSHELRTPLNAVLGFAQLLVRDVAQPLTPQQRERVDSILGAGHHLLSLIDDVLQLARIDADPRPMASQAVVLDEVCRETVAWLAQMARERAVTIELPHGALPGVVHAERRLTGQVLTNLLSNAVKYNRRGGWVRVASMARELDGQPGWELSVSDTGRGLSAEQIERVFQPFERLDAESEGIEGTGIGLAIVRQLVERMRGRVRVESTPGMGSVFSIWLPAEIALPLAPAYKRDDGPSVPEANLAPLKLLCIEDNPVNMVLVREVLALRPHVVFRGAESAHDGLLAAREWQPEIVLLDLQLPDLHGFEVLKRLRADPTMADTTVIALSANAMPQDVQDAHRQGFDDYWTKPIEIERFLRDIDEVISRVQGASRSRDHVPSASR